MGVAGGGRPGVVQLPALAAGGVIGSIMQLVEKTGLMRPSR
jgi:hypothetical protein